MPEPGVVSILNVGAGDMKLTFDRCDVAERLRSSRIVRDMLRRGYVLLIEVDRDGTSAYERVLEFRDDVCEYIIADFDSEAAMPPTATAAAVGDTHGTEREAEARGEDAAAGAAPKRRGRPRKAVPAESARVVAIARSAGG